MKRYQKILLASVATILLILGSIQIYFSFFLDEQLKNTVVSRFHEATNNSYQLDIEDFDLQILGRQFQLHNLTLSKTDTVGITDINASLERLTVSGIGFFNLLFQQELRIKNITFVNPTLNVSATAQASGNDKEPTQWSRMSQRLSAIGLQVLNAITIPEISIRGLSVTYNQENIPIQPYLSVTNSDIQLMDIKIDSSSLQDQRILPSDDITTTIRNFRYHSSNELYELTADHLFFSSSTGNLGIGNLRLRPRFAKREFMKEVGHETDRIDMKVKNISCQGIDTKTLNKAEGISLHKITVTEPNLDIFHDKRPPSQPNGRQPLLPQQMIRAIPFPVNIDSISLSNGFIQYAERLPKADTAGYITFNDLSATINELTNVESRWSNGWVPSLSAQTNIMDSAHLTAKFSFPMDSDNQHITGSLESMNMKKLNKVLEPLAFVRIDDGTIKSMDFNMDLGPASSAGTITFLYNGLKISLLNKESNDENLGDKVKSLLANTFKIKSNNTTPDPRTGTIKFERDPKKSVFNYWWKSLLSGLKSSIGI